MNKLTYLIITAVVINIVVFIIYGVDKLKAKKKAWRIPEATLLIAAVFGPVGALLGMRIWHHKTKKPKFFITVPLILVLEIIIAVLLFLK